MEEIEIEVLKFKTIVKRHDIKCPQWFAVEFDLLEHPDFFDITGDELKAYIWMVGIATKLNTSKIIVFPDLFQRRTGVSKKALHSSIEKLSGKRFAVRNPNASVRDPNVSVRNPGITRQDKTLQDTTEQNTIDQNRTFKILDSQLDEIYSHYPRKVGKESGFTKIRRAIKTREDLDGFVLAVQNYAKLCEIEKTEKKFIKHFSTFVGCWRDYREIAVSELSPKVSLVNQVVFDEIRRRREAK